jgi:hypothetical protein
MTIETRLSDSQVRGKRAECGEPGDPYTAIPSAVDGVIQAGEKGKRKSACSFRRRSQTS